MNTLSNVDNSRGDDKPPGIGSAPDVTTETKSLEAGVSSQYARKKGHEWYVLRVTYNRSSKAIEAFKNTHIQTYLPMHTAFRLKGEKKERILEPLLNNIIFAYSTKEEIEEFMSRTPISKSCLRYFRDRLQPKGQDDKHPPLTIRYDEMINFIRITSVYNEHIKLIDMRQCLLKCKEKVIITEGAFKGIIGRVVRVCGQQRVMVHLEGVCAIATAYIPSAFMRVIK